MADDALVQLDRTSASHASRRGFNPGRPLLAIFSGWTDGEYQCTVSMCDATEKLFKFILIFSILAILEYYT